ncbi:MAG: formyl-CoA transferase [Desulfovibrio sp.]|nr:formyl-CoA transferase [Desulfovibrio sp.]
MAKQVAPLEGIRIVDFTNVQSGPSCTQLLAWLGADVWKIEEPGRGDPTRKELQFNPDLPSYYYLQLNSDKKSIALDAKTKDGYEILKKMIEGCDMFIENLHPGAMDKLGFSWEVVHKLNPKCIYGSIKGFPVTSQYAHLKAYEPIAQVTGAAATTTGWFEGQYNIPTQSGAALGDSNTGMHLCIGLLAALAQREKTGEGCFVYQSMHNACLNLCRIKTRDQLTLDKIGYLTQYPQYPDQKFPDYVPRAGNIEGGGVLGWTYACKGFYQNPPDTNDFVYIILQREEKSFKLFCEGTGFTDWLTNPDFATADARDRNKQAIYKRLGEWCKDKNKFEVTAHLAKYEVPVGPVLNTREILTDKSLYDGNTLVKINQPGPVGEFVTVGVPFTLSSFQPTYGPCPELGGNTAEILDKLGFSKAQQEEFRKNGTTHVLPDGKM